MNERTPDALEIRRYLLRELPENERTRLEESYFSDDEVLDRVEAEEDQLVSDYVMGRLDETERRRFEDSLLASPYYRERVETTTRLRRRIASDRGFRRLLAGPSGGHPGAHGARLFPGRTGSVVAFALLTTLLIAALVSATRLKGQLEEARRSARPPEPVFVLLPAASPEAGPRPARRVARPLAAPLLLVLPGPAGDGPALEATLLAASGQTAWQGRAEVSPAGDSVFRVPAGSVAPGRYDVRVTAGNAPRAAAAVDLVEPRGRSLEGR